MSSLTNTFHHPLMPLASPADENYPDLIADIKKLSTDETNQHNSSKNNLFYPEKNSPSISNNESCTNRSSSPNGSNNLNLDIDGPSLNKSNQNTTKKKFNLSIPLKTPVQAYKSVLLPPFDSPTKLKSLPNIIFPQEVQFFNSTPNGSEPNSISTPDIDKSLYQTFIDPYKGNVKLVQSTPKSARKVIKIEIQSNEGNEDNISGCSLNSDEVYELADGVPEPEVYMCTDGATENPAEHHLDSEDDSPRANTLSEYSEPIPEYSAAEERADERSCLKVKLANGETKSVDIKVIEPFKRVLSHGGYSSIGAAVIVFSACHLPDSNRVDYDYVMDNLLLYILWTLERLVTDEYVMVYLHGSAESHRLPKFKWLKKSYYLIDRRLRKSLKQLYLVHPTLLIKSILWMSKPFISSKFYHKVTYVKKLSEIIDKIPIQPAAIPDKVKKYDSSIA